MSSKNDQFTSKNDPVKKGDPVKSDPVKGPGKSEATTRTAVAARWVRGFSRQAAGRRGALDLHVLLEIPVFGN